jgi:hypothetical protein
MNEQPIQTVTIPLEEYNNLRERAYLNAFLIDKLTMFESRMINLEQRVCNIEFKP